MKRLIPLLALFTALGAPAPAALADDTESGPDIDETMEHLVATTQQWRAAMIADYYASLIAVDEVSPSTARGRTGRFGGPPRRHVLRRRSGTPFRRGLGCRVQARHVRAGHRR